MRLGLLVIAMFFFCGISQAQIYTPTVPTQYGSNFLRVKPFEVLHLPQKPNFDLGTIDTSAQIRVVSGSVWAYYSGSWHELGGDSSGGIDPAVPITWSVRYISDDRPTIVSTGDVDFVLVDGDKFLVSITPEGEFSLHANEIATYSLSGDNFTFEVPAVGNLLNNADESLVYQWDGTSWNQQGSLPLFDGGQSTTSFASVGHRVFGLEIKTGGRRRAYIDAFGFWTLTTPPGPYVDGGYSLLVRNNTTKAMQVIPSSAINSQDLQSVTDIGANTSNTISVSNSGYSSSIAPQLFSATDLTTGESLFATPNGFALHNSTSQTLLSRRVPLTDIQLYLPEAPTLSNLATSVKVNGVDYNADNTGNIDIGTISGGGSARFAVSGEDDTQAENRTFVGDGVNDFNLTNVYDFNVAGGDYIGLNSDVRTEIQGSTAAITLEGSITLNQTAGIVLYPLTSYASGGYDILGRNQTTGKMEYVSGGSSGVISVGTFDNTSTANGMSISGTAIKLHAADATNPGAITTGAQPIAGVKTFTATSIKAPNLANGSTTDSMLVWNSIDGIRKITVTDYARMIINQYSAKQTANAWFDTLKLVKLITDSGYIGTGRYPTMGALNMDSTASARGFTMYGDARNTGTFNRTAKFYWSDTSTYSIIVGSQSATKNVNFGSGVSVSNSLSLSFRNVTGNQSGGNFTVYGLNAANDATVTGSVYFTGSGARGLTSSRANDNFAGKDLSITAGQSSTGAATSLAGGNLNLSSGLSEGTSVSTIRFLTPSAGTSGVDNTPSLKLTINGNGTADYAANYGSLYTARTLVDKGYADSLISSSTKSRRWDSTYAIDVFIIAGQSNALPQGASSGPTPKQGTAFQYYGNIIKYANDPVGPTTSGTGTAWPAFAIKYFNETGRKICFVQTAVGGSVMHQNAEPNSLSWDVGGDLYPASVAATNAALDSLRNRGFSPVLKGVLWAQGEKDATNNTAGATTVAQYKSSFRTLINAYRTSFSDSLGFYIFRTGTSTSVSDVGFARIRQAQEDVADSMFMTSVVFRNSLDFAERSMLEVDGVHYSQAGANEMGYFGAEGVVSGKEETSVKTQTTKTGIGTAFPEALLQVGANTTTLPAFRYTANGSLTTNPEPLALEGINTGLYYSDSVSTVTTRQKIGYMPVKVKVSGSNVNTTVVTASDITGLSVPVLANRTYTLTAVLYIGCNNTGGSQFAITGPTGTTVGAGQYTGSAAAANTGNLVEATANGVLTSSTAFNRIAAGNGMVQLLVDVTIGSTAGDLKLQFSSDVAGQQSTVYTTSWMQVLETQ